MNLRDLKSTLPSPVIDVKPIEVEWVKHEDEVADEKPPIKALGSNEIHNVLFNAVELLDKAQTILEEATDPALQRRIPFDLWNKILRCEMDIAVFLKRIRV